MTDFGKMIRKSRQDMGLNIRIAASKIGISYAYLSKLETGICQKPKMDILYKIVDFYALPLDKACIAAQRVPKDVFYKIINHPELIHVIREYEAKDQ